MGPGGQATAEGPSEDHCMRVILDASHVRGFSPRDCGAAQKLTLGY